MKPQEYPALRVPQDHDEDGMPSEGLEKRTDLHEQKAHPHLPLAASREKEEVLRKEEALVRAVLCRRLLGMSAFHVLPLS